MRAIPTILPRPYLNDISVYYMRNMFNMPNIFLCTTRKPAGIDSCVPIHETECNEHFDSIYGCF